MSSVPLHSAPCVMADVLTGFPAALLPVTALSDPYVIVQFGNETGRVQVSRTTTKNNTLNPVYNEVRCAAAPLPGLRARN